MDESVSFSDGDLLIERLISAAEQDEKIAILVGSPLTAASLDGVERGVPGVQGILDLIRTRLSHRPELLRRYDERLAGVHISAERYQRATQFVVEVKGQPELNAIVRQAVLAAGVRRSTTPVIEADLDRLEDSLDDWHLRTGVSALGNLLVEFPATFVSPILTTNFDPLIEVSIRRSGGTAQSIFLHADGRLDNVRGGPTHRVVHLHGHWLRDTLHTPIQLTRARPQLKGSLRDLLESTTLLVIAYGGWNDIFTKSLREVIREGGNKTNVLWSFFQSEEAAILRDNNDLITDLAPAVGQRLVFYKGIDCHAFFPKLLSALRSAPSPQPPASPPIDLDRRDAVAQFEIGVDGSGATALASNEAPDRSAVDASGGIIPPQPQAIGATEDFLEAPPDRKGAEDRLRSVPRWRQQAEPQHRRIRIHEQQRLREALACARAAWIVADWGLAKDAFIASALEGDGNENTFRMNLNGVDLPTLLPAFLSEITSLFKMPLEQLAPYLAKIGRATIVLDNLPYANVVDGSGLEFREFEERLQAVLDFAQELRLILVSRRAPAGATYPVVKLTALDEADTATYVAEHPAGGPELGSSKNTGTLFRLSDGVPMLLEKCLRNLRYVSIDDIGEVDVPTSDGDLATSLEPIPATLKDAIAELSRQTDRDSHRSLNMLKVLSMYPLGETFQNIRRFYPAEPFYPDHVDRLERVGLVESTPWIPLGRRLEADTEPKSDRAAPKLLSVPRPVRDYLRGAMKDDEKIDIAYSAATTMFGEKWRDGKFKFSSLVTESIERGGGTSNPHAVVCELLRDAVKKDERVTVRRVLRIAEAYLGFLNDNDRYRDMANMGTDVLHIVDAGEREWDTARVLAQTGYGLRMTGDSDGAIAACRKAIDRANPELGAAWKSGVWMDLAYAYQRKGDVESAAGAARQVISLEEKDSGRSVSAESILAEIDVKLSDAAKVSKLRELEAVARKKGSLVAANNIAVRLAQLSVDLDERYRLHSVVLSSTKEKGGYTYVRSLVNRCADLVGAGRISEISERERRQIRLAYCYLYSQRFSLLFNQCHDIMWSIAQQERRESMLVRLFRYASFVWRIAGDQARERTALGKLRRSKIALSAHDSTDDDVVYLRVRLNAVNEK